MKYYFTLFLLFLLLNTGRSQNARIDSLNKLLVEAKNDSDRVLILVKLSRLYIYSKPETTEQLAETGRKISRKIKYKKGEALCLVMIGTVIGLTGNYPKSLETLLQALKINETINDLPGIATCNISIGNSYNDQGEYNKSIVYYFKAKAIAEEIHNNNQLMATMINLGDSYEKLNNLDSARINAEEAYQLADSLNDIEDKGASLSILGNIFAKMAKNEMALEYYRKSIPYSTLVKDFDNLCEITMGLARLFEKAGKTDSALLYAHQSLDLSQQSGFTKRALDASNFISAFYERNHMVDSAFVYQKVTIAAKDSLFSQEKEKELRNLSFAEQTRQMEIENAMIEAEAARRKNIQMAAIGVFIPIFFSVVLYFSRRKKKSKAFRFMGLLALLLFFEFIALLIHPYIEEWTHSTPVLMLLILVAIASFLVPMHHKLEHWVKEKLAQNPHTNIALTSNK